MLSVFPTTFDGHASNITAHTSLQIVVLSCSNFTGHQPSYWLQLHHAKWYRKVPNGAVKGQFFVFERCCKVPVGAAKCQKVPGAAKVPKRCIVGKVLQSANRCCKVPKGRSRFLFWKGAAKCQWVLQSAKRSLKISYLEGCCKKCQ